MIFYFADVKRKFGIFQALKAGNNLLIGYLLKYTDYDYIVEGFKLFGERWLTISKDIAIVLSSKRYQELTKPEDILYVKAAQLAIKEGLAAKSEVVDLVKNIG